MLEKNRYIVAFIVMMGVFASLTVGGFLVVTRTLDWTDDKAMYFREEYTSTYEVFIDDESKAEELVFKSESTKEDDEWKAVVEWDDDDYDDLKVSTDGFVLDNDDKETDNYFFLWWEEEDLKFTDNINGNGLALIAEDPKKEIIDPYGIFLNENETYVAVCKNSLVYLKGRFATQASFKYIIKRESDDRVVGHAIIDQTSGIAFELSLYEEGFDSVYIKLLDTDFPISRNRYRLLAAASIVMPIVIIGFYFLAKKKLEIEGEELQDMLFLVGMGLFAFYIDQFLDFWYTYTIIMPIILIVHFIPIVLILIFKRELWHYSFIPLVELAIYAMFVAFNMGIYVLWLSYGNVMLWLALLTHYHYTEDNR
ncbi:MAG: hypothetical protein ACTSR8_22335 [Promethearchaeota archaeon]